MLVRGDIGSVRLRVLKLPGLTVSLPPKFVIAALTTMPGSAAKMHA